MIHLQHCTHSAEHSLNLVSDPTIILLSYKAFEVATPLRTKLLQQFFSGDNFNLLWGVFEDFILLVNEPSLNYCETSWYCIIFQEFEGNILF